MCAFTQTTTTESLDVHKGTIRDQMLPRCCCRVTHIFINHDHNSPPFKQLNIWATSPPTMPLKNAVPGLESTKVRHDKKASNLMITITCSPSTVPYSRWFVSNWSVPFAWLIWLPHFSLSPLWWLLWHYRCWVSLIMSLIGLEMLHASLFWGKVVVCCEALNHAEQSICFSYLKR